MTAAPTSPSSDDFALLLAARGIHGAEARRAVTEGYRVLERFLAAFNARDAKRWAGTLHYPHVRLAGGEVRVWPTAEDYAQSNDLAAFASATGWSHSRWDRIEPVQADGEKVHFALRFTRYDAAEKPLASFEALYVVTRQGERWGVQSRSSYAGVAIAGAAF